MVILGAVVVVALCLGIGAGRLTLADGRVEAAAAAAARAASQESSPSAATAAAQEMARTTLSEAGTTCAPTVAVDTSNFEAAGRVNVTVRCRVNLSLVAIAGFDAHRTLSASSAAPLEQHRSYHSSKERP
ncbi:hypothetical protein Kisp01_69590 [Kineosporia sp. NBRC 101677]|nr:hypothetical protein Kisp01_69590 [Kineosporia sp. NBRC 101677]